MHESQKLLWLLAGGPSRHMLAVYCDEFTSKIEEESGLYIDSKKLREYILKNGKIRRQTLKELRELKKEKGLG